jgi:hypothetical protein
MARPFIKPAAFMLGNVFRNGHSIRSEITANWRLLEEKDGKTKSSNTYLLLFELSSKKYLISFV